MNRVWPEPRLAELPRAFIAHPVFAVHRPYWPPRRSGSPRLVLAPGERRPALAFEAHTIEHDELLVRADDRHDSLNALVWRSFPQTKRAISELHFTLGHDPTSANGRPRRRDVLTLFDEAGILLVSERVDLRLANVRHDWETLFVRERAAWFGAIRPILFGHGALEQLSRAFDDAGLQRLYRGLTVKALWLEAPVTLTLTEIDVRLAEGIRTGRLLASDEPRIPLPLIGVPGWFAENEDARLYADREIFRPPRAGSLKHSARCAAS